MAEYSELVKALRECARDDADCRNCPYYNHDVCTDDLKSDAADAIEALQAAEPTERQVVDYCHKRCFVVIEADLFHELKASYGKLPKRGEWKPFDLTYGRSIYSCSVCEQATEVPMCMEKPMYAYCPNCGAKMKEVQDEAD